MRVITVIDNVVTSVKGVLDGYVLEANELESANGETGQIMQPDGTFIDSQPTQITLEPTIEDKINYIYYKQMGVI